MKTFELNQMCGILGINVLNKEKITIKKVVSTLSEIDNDTLVFHLDKKLIFNWRKIEQCDNCFIITDQPLLKDYSHLKNKFIFVLDITKTYDKFIDYYRQQFSLKTIAVTGTCGKTTTKEMIKQVLSKKYNVTGTNSSKNALRFNHDYLMDIDETKDYGVYETALTEPGHILISAKYFKPNIGIITNIGIDHLSGCKTLDNYIRAKGEMLSALGYNGTLVINDDDENIKKIDFSVFKGKIITTGILNKANYYATDIRYGSKMMHFILHHDNLQYKVAIPGIGKHNVYNALQALAALDAIGMNLDESIKYIRDFKPIKSHFEIHKGYNNSIVVDDTWSSNPTSLKAALESLKIKNKTKVAVLGNIFYLGAYALEQAQKIGKMIVDYKIDNLVTIDSFSKKIGEAAISYGMDEKNVFHCRNNDELVSILSHLLKPDVVVLFKTSMYDNETKIILDKFIIDEQ